MNASVILYMLSSSTMLILNKMALANFNSPAGLLIIQLWFSACFVYILGRSGVIELNELSYKTANEFKLVPLSFLLILYANMKILQHSNVETFIIIRASTTVIMSILDVEFLNRQLPSLKSWVSIIGVLACTIGYGFAEHTDLTSDSLIWIVIWYSLFCFDQIYIKHVVDTFTSMNRWDMVFYNNSIPLLLLVPFFIFTEDSINISDYGLFFIILSCFCGITLSFCGFWTRKEVSATKFTVIGNVCKFLTILLNYLLWDRHASETGIFLIIVGIVFTFGYNQSPIRDESESKPSLVFFYSVCTLMLLFGIYFIYNPTNVIENDFESTKYIIENKLDTKPYISWSTKTGVKNESTCNVVLNYGIQTMPYCGALKQLRPKPHTTPKWLRDKISNGNLTDIRFSLQQQLVSRTPFKPQKVLTGLGLLELENGDYVGLNRKIQFDLFTEKEPHKSEQMVEFFDKEYFPKDATRPCMIGFGADIRIFQHKNQVLGYTIMTSENKSNNIDMILYNLNTCIAYVVSVDVWETFKKFGKNWMPFTFNSELYFVHSLVPKLTLVKVNISDEITEYRNTKVGKLPILKGKVIQSKTSNNNKKQLNRRGSTHGIVFDNYVWGIGHSSDYRDPHNSFQRPFLWYFNFIDLDSPVEFIEMVEERNDQPRNRFIFPISILSNNEELMMIATDSVYNWFGKETMKGYYPLSNVKNTLFKLT